MLNIVLEEKYLLDYKYLRDITSIAFDGEKIYVCDKNKPVIYRLCSCGKLMGFFHVDRCYRAISYDYREECYWAIGYENNRCIYKLNKIFDEIGRINIIKLSSMTFTSIYYDNYSQVMFLYTPELIYTISKKGEVFNMHKNPCESFSCCGCSIGDKKIVIYNYNHNHYKMGVITIFDERRYSSIKIKSLPEKVYGAGICSAFDCNNNPYLFVLAFYESNEPYLLKYKCSC